VSSFSVGTKTYTTVRSVAATKLNLSSLLSDNSDLKPFWEKPDVPNLEGEGRNTLPPSARPRDRLDRGCQHVARFLPTRR
jgi:hypothetical protein